MGYLRPFVLVALVSASPLLAQSGTCVLFADAFDGPALSPAWSIATSGAGGGSVSGGNFVLVAPGAPGAFTSAKLTAPGTSAWTDYTMAFDFFINPSSCDPYPSADALVRYDPVADTGYVVAFYSAGINLWHEGAVLDQYVPAAIPVSVWHHAQIQLAGASIAVAVDGVTLFSTALAFAATHTHGTIGFDDAGCSTDLFDNLTVTAACPPTISSISLGISALPGGTPITITGTGFLNLPSTSATIGGQPMTSMAVWSSTEIFGFSPALPTAQVADVSVTTLGGTATLPGAVTYGPAMVGISGTPQIGGAFTLWISSYPSSPIILLADTMPGMFQLGQFGSSGLAFSAALTPVLDFFGAFTGIPDSTAATNATGQWSAGVVVPNVPALAGMTVYGQVFTFSFFPMPPNTLFFIGNVMQLTFLP